MSYLMLVKMIVLLIFVQQILLQYPLINSISTVHIQVDCEEQE